jgi:glycosyltransferase involved in cell wall biosynthesis
MASQDTANNLNVLIEAMDLSDPPAGLGTYARELASALAEKPDITVQTAFGGSAPEQTTPFPMPDSHRQLWRQFVLPWRMKRSGIDVFHGTQFGGPVIERVPRVTTVHDLSFIKFPKTYTKQGRRYYTNILRTGLRAERVITPSTAVADDIVGLTSYPRSKIRVTPLAPATATLEQAVVAAREPETATQVERPYLLCVGVGSRRKRVVDAVRALMHLPTEFRLVVVGKDTSGATRRLEAPLTCIESWPSKRASESRQRADCALESGLRNTKEILHARPYRPNCSRR